MHIICQDPQKCKDKPLRENMPQLPSNQEKITVEKKRKQKHSPNESHSNKLSIYLSHIYNYRTKRKNLGPRAELTNIFVHWK